GLSWILATDPNPEVRNGAEAVRMAERACQLTEFKNARMLLTLAAAYAEAGRKNEGIALAQKARIAADDERDALTSQQAGALFDALRGSDGNSWRSKLAF